MNVKQLIKKLQKIKNQNADIILEGDGFDSYTFRIDGVYVSGDSVRFSIGPSDNDESEEGDF